MQSPKNNRKKTSLTNDVYTTRKHQTIDWANAQQTRKRQKRQTNYGISGGRRKASCILNHCFENESLRYNTGKEMGKGRKGRLKEKGERKLSLGRGEREGRDGTKVE